MHKLYYLFIFVAGNKYFQMLVNIKNVQILEKVPATKLTRLQDLVCRLFKIIPKTTYFYRIGVEVQQGKLRLNDVVIGADRYRWIVIGKDSKKYILSCPEPMLTTPVIGYQVRVLGRVAPEKANLI